MADELHTYLTDEEADIVRKILNKSRFSEKSRLLKKVESNRNSITHHEAIIQIATTNRAIDKVIT